MFHNVQRYYRLVAQNFGARFEVTPDDFCETDPTKVTIGNIEALHRRSDLQAIMEQTATGDISIEIQDASTMLAIPQKTIIDNIKQISTD